MRRVGQLESNGCSLMVHSALSMYASVAVQRVRIYL
jgi:hypothetical protein